MARGAGDVEIQACPACASLKMRVPGIGDGAMLGYATVTAVCPDCGFQGAPLLFDDARAYEAFRGTVRDDGAGEAGARDGPEDRQGPAATPGRVAAGPGAPASALLIGALGAFGLVSGGFLAFGGAAAMFSDGTSAVRVALVAAFLVQSLISLALLRIARRLWRAPGG